MIVNVEVSFCWVDRFESTSHLTVYVRYVSAGSVLEFNYKNPTFNIKQISRTYIKGKEEQ